MEKHIHNTSLFSKSAALTLTAVNVILFFITEAFPSVRAYLSLNSVLIIHGRMYWQFISYMFVHGSLMHLLGNMLGLVFFGTAVERKLGTKQFLILYFSSGLASGALSFAVYAAAGMNHVFLLGASGAVYAVLLVFSVLFPRTLIYLWGLLPVPAPILVAVFALIEIFSQLFSVNSGIAHTTHLSGFAAAWLYVKIRMKKSPLALWKEAYRK
ncbi:rhomboid family intramembrane serine protease [Treponema sp. HNW]|uniref:rhomboid family intramembrane serine protease n=1 Tax=Treponema sp. HNW TaxID=3116654 RepID=UPI003D0FC438